MAINAGADSIEHGNGVTNEQLKLMRASMNPPNHLASLEARPKRTRKLSTFLAALFFAIFMAGQLTAQSPASVTLVKACGLLDPRTGNVLSPAAVLIEAGKIKEVGPPARIQPPAGAKTIDLGSA